METNEMLRFLTALRENNTKEWMQENKQWYKQVLKGFEGLVRELILRISQEDGTVAHLDAHELIFRLNRDTRFSHDKSPYNPSLRAHISAGGRMPIPAGYYLHITPGGSFLGGGIFAQIPSATEMVREYIAQHGDKLEALIKAPCFEENFTLLGEKLKNVPKGYEKDHPYGEYLKHKSWDVEYHIEDAVVCNTQRFLQLAAEKFLLMRPLNDFLNTALSGFQMPQR